MLSIFKFFSLIVVVATTAACPFVERHRYLPLSSTQYWIDQPVDHFGKNNNVWKQQYLVNATFYQPGGPIFVSTPGESPVVNKYIDDTHFTSLAKQANGLLVTIEHRFFGASNPMPDLTGESLKYMTIENSLEDFASFLRQAKANPSKLFPNMGISKDAKAIFGGGSYSGNVAAWMRARYPHLVHSAWASSAIVYSRLLNYQFDLSFGRHLAALGCAGGVSQAVKDADSVLLSENATALASLQTQFGVPPLTASDTAGLLSALSTAYSMTPVTKSGDPVDASVCSFFTKKLNPLDAYAASTKHVIKERGMPQNALVQMGNSSLGIDNYSLGQIGRVWYYMSCTWFGDWQVAPPANTGIDGYRSQLVNLNYFQDNCQKKFGTGVVVPVNVARYNRQWFDILKGVTNIYYTTGSLDIWRDSTVITSTGTILPKVRGTVFKVIEGATHVQDLSAERIDDLDSVRNARRIGDVLIKRWLSDE